MVDEPALDRNMDETGFEIKMPEGQEPLALLDEETFSQNIAFVGHCAMLAGCGPKHCQMVAVFLPKVCENPRNLKVTRWLSLKRAWG